MAALAELFSQMPFPRVADLRDFRAHDLAGVLEAEDREWRETLDWDFGNSAELVRKFVDQGGLNGAVLLVGGGVRGYAYYVFEDGKGLIGDLYVQPDYRTPAHEALLLNTLMDQIAAIGGVPRVEAQILMLSAELERPARHWKRYQTYRRAFLGLRLPMGLAMEERTLAPYIALQLWGTQDQEPAAHLIPATYAGHNDSLINDQYRNVAGARKFLHNIVQFPGCGVFDAGASIAAYDRRDGSMCGMVLSSMVGPRSGHITQLCVHPEYQRGGLGHELLRHALALLMAEGCRTVSLTVTTENRTARMLYERIGFHVLRKFAAYVWEP